MFAAVPPSTNEATVRDYSRSTLPPSPVASFPSSRLHVDPPTSRSSASAFRPPVDHPHRETWPLRILHFAPRFRELGALFYSTLRAILVFALLCLTSVPSFISQYVVLLAIWRLDSFSRPLINLTGLAAAALNADPNGLAAADGRVRAAWRLYSRGILQDLEVASAVCASILTLTIGLLTITNIADEVMAQTLAYLCVFACTVGVTTALNMRRHLNNVVQLTAAPFDWAELARRNEHSGFAAVPMLLAGPTAWATWSIGFFITLLLTCVLRFRQSTIGLNVFHDNSTLPILLFTAVDLSKSDNNADPSDSSIYFTWASRIVLIVEFAVALVCFVHNAYCFTKLGLPFSPTNDVELANSQPAQSNTAVPGTTGNVAIPPTHGLQLVVTNAPVTAAVLDNSDAATLDEASHESSTSEDPEDEDGDRVLVLSL